MNIFIKQSVSIFIYIQYLYIYIYISFLYWCACTFPAHIPVLMTSTGDFTASLFQVYFHIPSPKLTNSSPLKIGRAFPKRKGSKDRLPSIHFQLLQKGQGSKPPASLLWENSEISICLAVMQFSLCVCLSMA